MRPQICNRWLAIWLVLMLLAGCASPPRIANPPEQAVSLWAGRLSLRVEADASSSFTAGFELKGNAQFGELSLYGPFGATIAKLAWTPNDARLRANGTERSFDSLDALVKEATGTELPVSSIFQWLAGESVSSGGWQADLSGLGSGRLLARRDAPPPAMELRLVLE